ncbi:MAG: hypothetical protein M3362_01920 [Acidobacteriota bacterium]|nr:hypothetical protein [Acidobacteriota bacterium]
MKSRAKPNNGMHPTADTNDVINIRGLGRRVMPGVRRRYDERAQGFEEPVWLRRSAPRAGFGGSWTPPNKPMHPTADTDDVMLR